MTTIFLLTETPFSFSVAMRLFATKRTHLQRESKTETTVSDSQDSAMEKFVLRESCTSLSSRTVWEYLCLQDCRHFTDC